MDCPVLEKTWQIWGNDRTFLAQADQSSINRAQLLRLKDLMKGATGAWTVKSSCDSVAAGNNDSVDRWIDIGDLVFGTGAHSWAVLEQSAIGTKASLLFDCNDATAAMADGTIVYSPAAGFGLANGGANGTTTARPTATDEVVLRSSAAWCPSLSDQVMHTWISTDGSQLWHIRCEGGEPTHLLAFGAAKGPVAGWAPANWCIEVRGTGDVLTYANLCTANTYTRFRDNTKAAAGLAYLATIGVAGALGSTNAAYGRGPHSLTGGFPFTPMILASASTNLVGMWGAIFDAYYGPDQASVAHGEQAKDDDDTIRFAKFGALWLPWTAAQGRPEFW